MFKMSWNFKSMSAATSNATADATATASAANKNGSLNQFML